MIDRFWFADVDHDGEVPGWQPCLETSTGIVPCFDLWFPTEQECLDWIRDNVIGAPLGDI